MRLATLALAALLAIAGCSAQRSHPQPQPRPQPQLSYGACSLLKGTSRAAHEIERCAARQ
jgi:uncharacterized protein YceK